MAIDICQACGCCNHCNARHAPCGDYTEANCPLDPDMTQEQVRQVLRDDGVSDEAQERHLNSVMQTVRLSLEKMTLFNRIGSALTALQDDVTGDCNVCGETENKGCSACTAIMHLSAEAK